MIKQNAYDKVLKEIREKLKKYEQRDKKRVKHYKTKRTEQQILNEKHIIETLKAKRDLINEMKKVSLKNTIIYIDTNIIFTDNMIKILKALEKKDLCRKEICQQLNKPRTTIYDNLKRLENGKYIYRYSKKTTYRGRPKIFWSKINDN